MMQNCWECYHICNSFDEFNWFSKRYCYTLFLPPYATTRSCREVDQESWEVKERLTFSYPSSSKSVVVFLISINVIGLIWPTVFLFKHKHYFDTWMNVVYSVYTYNICLGSGKEKKSSFCWFQKLLIKSCYWMIYGCYWWYIGYKHKYWEELLQRKDNCSNYHNK